MSWREVERALATYFRSSGCEIEQGDGNLYLWVATKGDQLDQVSISKIARELADGWSR
jgi:hypothetical protein